MNEHRDFPDSSNANVLIFRQRIREAVEKVEERLPNSMHFGIYFQTAFCIEAVRWVRDNLSDYAIKEKVMGKVDQSIGWNVLTQSERSSLVDELHEAVIKCRDAYHSLPAGK